MTIQTLEEAEEAIAMLAKEAKSQEEQNLILVLECYAGGACFLFDNPFASQIEMEIERLRAGEPLQFEYVPLVVDLLHFFARPR
ncbi:hypothetical protein MK805_16325 [Shimazuella sp. AN120528]|uniref:hypothetical protein n=1 Tax=Shimazuella soli TaxID=1892854 RepID=UPI001F0F9EFC|nr:hypothetical protein [Shimazuella soli]MCH5586507.1 hypothetical protein [Shimazuella soli]